MLGARIGRGVCWLGRHIPEADMLWVDDETVVAPGVDVFTHDQENMRYTYDVVTVGSRCILGERSSVMGGSQVHDGAQLLPLAQGMKGFNFLAGRMYGGNPASPNLQDILNV